MAQLTAFYASATYNYFAYNSNNTISNFVPKFNNFSEKTSEVTGNILTGLFGGRGVVTPDVQVFVEPISVPTIRVSAVEIPLVANGVVAIPNATSVLTEGVVLSVANGGPSGFGGGSSGGSGSNNKYTGGRTQEELDDLARDPAQGGKMTRNSEKEREIGLELEQRGELGKIIRDPQAENGAEFIDEITGVKWDVKGFVSYPKGDNGVPITSPKKGAFTVEGAMSTIHKEFGKGNNVIIDTRNLIPEHVNELMKAVIDVGISTRIIWYP